MRMSPTPLCRSVSPQRRADDAEEADGSEELSVIEKLQARVWLMEEELAFATKIQARTGVELGEWHAKLLGLQLKLKEAMAEHRRMVNAREERKPAPLTQKQQEQAAMLEKLKRHIAALSEKRQEINEEIEALKEGIQRSKSVDEADHGSREELLEEQAQLRAKIIQTSEAREEQQLAYDEYEARREEVIQKEVSKIEAHVMGKLDAVASGKRSQQLEVTAMQEETGKLDNELLGKTRVKDVLASQLVDAQAEFNKKVSKKEDYAHSSHSMQEQIAKAKLQQEQANKVLNEILAKAPVCEQKLQRLVAKERKEGILCLEEKAALLDALGNPGKAAKVREKINSMRLRLDFCPKFINLTSTGLEIKREP